MRYTEEMYLFVISFFSCHDISMKILPRIPFELEGFLSSVRCMLGENDCQPSSMWRII